LKERLVPLDSLRGIAAIGIAFFWHLQHFGYTQEIASQQPYYSIFKWFYSYGWNLVDLFFVVSGFVMMYVYAEKIIHKQLKFDDYIILRLSRLYPLHIIALLLVTFFQLFRVSLHFSPFIYENNDVYHFLLNIFLLHGGFFERGFSFNGPSWVITSELVAYIIFFFIISKIKSKYIAFFGMIILGIFILKCRLYLPFFNPNIARGLAGFFIGCITYKLNDVFFQSKTRKNFLIVSGLILLFISIIAIDLQTNFTTFQLGEYISLPILVYPLLIMVVLNVSFLNKSMSLAPLIFFGHISYSIFLLHFPIQILIDTATKYFGLTSYSYAIFYLFIAMTITSSWFTYKYVEAPLMLFLRRRLLARQV